VRKTDIEMGKGSKLKLSAGDLAGGFTAAIVSLPTNLMFGIIAFGPLGEQYVSLGVLAGMYSSVFVGIFASLFGGTPGMISGPKATTSLIFASILTLFLANKTGAAAGALQPMEALYIAFLAVLIGGIFQTLFAVFRLGDLIKYIPYPVIAGFLNGAAVLVIITQLGNLLGISGAMRSAGWLESLSQIKPLNVLVAAITIFSIVLINRRYKRVSSSVFGMIIGTLAYYLLRAAGLGEALGPVIGRIDFARPSLWLLREVNPELIRTIPSILPKLLPAAFSIALLGSIDSMLASLAIQNLTNVDPKTNKDLLGQGVGNMISACFGGIAGSGYVGRSSLNYWAGGRTRLSGVVYSITILLFVLFLFPVIGFVPRAVIAGVLVMMALQIIDRWSVGLYRKLLFQRVRQKRELLVNFVIITAVTLVTVFFNLVMAVIVGIVLAILMFVVRMSKNVIRRSYSGNMIHSRTKRDEKHIAVLKTHGDQIRVIELEGVLFFGSADRFATELRDQVREGARYVILDMKRVDEIDSTGVRILVQTARRLIRDGVCLALSYVQTDSRLWRFLSDFNVLDTIGNDALFTDTDAALEFFENRLLENILQEPVYEATIALEDFSCFSDLKKRELRVVTRAFQTVEFRKGETLFRQGDEGNALYLIAKGLADVTINLPGTQRRKRIHSLSAGTFFGEMALLDRRPRSANMEAREEMICYCLTIREFERLKKGSPAVALSILSSISKTIATRLRYANEMISDMEN